MNRKNAWAQLTGAAAVAILWTACLSAAAVAAPLQRTFSSPEEASNALLQAAQSNDEKAMLAILGQDARQVVSSGDETEDSQSRAMFVAKYKEMHRLVKEPDGNVVLYIGAENWPTPIPIANKGGAWYFDTEAGKKEILYRRVGRNEASAIRVCQELVAAQKEYCSTAHGQYAEKLFSDEGQHNGLYWKAASGEAQSPIGPLVAAAVAEGYPRNIEGGPTPYRGYYFRLLTKGQGQSYVVDGKMTDFAFVAYPAEYRASGVMTFVVSKDGEVFQKDLGKQTEALAKEMKEYNPDSSWKKAELPQEVADK